jgi:7,8-dihydroneopterin aldolase/epimerase/oxygenase
LTKYPYFNILKFILKDFNCKFDKLMPTDKLRVMGMIFHAYHGLEHDEMRNGQRFEVDLEMYYDATPSAKSDQLKDTIDVREVYNQVQKCVIKKRFYLIEAVGQHIADTIFENFLVDQVTIKVRKPFAPLGGLANGTEVEITRKRPGL